MKASVAFGMGCVSSSMLRTKASRSVRSCGTQRAGDRLAVASWWRAATSSSVCAEPSWKYGPE